MEYSIQLNATENADSHIKAFALVVFGDSFKVTNFDILTKALVGTGTIEQLHTEINTSTGRIQ